MPDGNGLRGSAQQRPCCSCSSTRTRRAQILSRLEPEEVRQLGYAMYDVADVEVRWRSIRRSISS